METSAIFSEHEGVIESLLSQADAVGLPLVAHYEIGYILANRHNFTNTQ